LYKPIVESVTATIGVYDLEDDPTKQVVTVQSWVIHPLYDPGKLRNDIAIVRLATTVSVRPIMITFDKGFPQVGTKTSVIGFGKESPDEDEISDELLEIKISVSKASYCQDNFGKDNFFNTIQICAGGSGKVREYPSTIHCSIGMPNFVQGSLHW
jgi:secreted trypsin-like serine protease